MQSALKRVTVVVAACLAGGLGVAFAQDSIANPVPDRAPLDAAEIEALTPQQMLKQAQSDLRAMEQGAAAVHRQLKEARAANDVVKALCLNDKLTQINVAIRTANERYTDLKGAVDRNEEARARHEFTVLLVLRDRLRALVTEANQCIGEETGFAGTARLTVEVDPNLPDQEGSLFPETTIATASETPITSSDTQ